MLVFRNGDLTRKKVRDQVNSNDLNWDYFNQCISETPVGCGGCLAFYFTETEITPNVNRTGIIKFNRDDQMSCASQMIRADCRGVIESQVLSFKSHADKLGLSDISSIVVTGGGSANKHILQIIADVFECEVCHSNIANTAAMGAALRAFNSYHSLNGLKSFDFESNLCEPIVQPIKQHYPIYRDLLSRFSTLEASAIQILNQ